MVAGSTIPSKGSAGTGISQRVGSKEYVNTSVGYRQKAVTNKNTVVSNRQPLQKPQSRKTNVRQTPVNREKSRVQPRYSKPSSRTQYTRQRAMPKPRYSKPKQYQRLDTQQPRGSKEYYRPRGTTQNRKQNVNRSSRERPRTSTAGQTRIRRQPIQRRQNVYRPTRSNNVRTTRPSSVRPSRSVKSYSSPRRSYSSPKSYSAPTRSRSTGSGGGSSRRSYSPSRSSFSGSSSSSGSSTRSSSSSSSSGSRGGRR